MNIPESGPEFRIEDGSTVLVRLRILLKMKMFMLTFIRALVLHQLL